MGNKKTCTGALNAGLYISAKKNTSVVGHAFDSCKFKEEIVSNE